MRYPARRGVSIVYLAIGMTVFIAFGSLGVDLGRVQVAKTELQRAADAAARAAASALPNVTDTQTLAQQYATANLADGANVDIQLNQDLEFGKWNTSAKTFTVLTGSARSDSNAVRITLRRTNNRQNGIPLLFGKVLGQATCDVNVSCIAYVNPYGYGMVGLDFISMSGNASISYKSSSGSTSEHGSIASNGNITLGGSTSISGDANPGVGKSVNGANKVKGSTTPLDSPLVYPNGDAGVYASTNDNSSLPSGMMSASSMSVNSNKTYTVPAGNYYFNNVDIKGTINLSGPTTFYVYGDFSLSGSATTNGNLPKNFNIVMVPRNGVPPGSLSVGGSSALYANIYAPQSAITLSGTGDIYGSIIGKSISMTGTSAVHYDLELAGKPGAISIVK